MRGLLVRVGIDQSQKAGRWNAPVDTETNRFMFIPISDRAYNSSGYIDGGKALFKTAVPKALAGFERECHSDGKCFQFPKRLLDDPMHLDPDFLHLTYGDDGERGRRLVQFIEDDFIAFYAGLNPVTPRHGGPKLVYALIGLFVLAGRPMEVSEVRDEMRLFNAHTRWRSLQSGDIVVQAKPGCSGLFSKCLPIGEYSNRAYRVKTELLRQWEGVKIKDGCKQLGIDVRDGYIQRSAYLPEFLNPESFRTWLDAELRLEGITMREAQYQVPLEKVTGL